MPAFLFCAKNQTIYSPEVDLFRFEGKKRKAALHRAAFRYGNKQVSGKGYALSELLFRFILVVFAAVPEPRECSILVLFPVIFQLAFKVLFRREVILLAYGLEFVQQALIGTEASILAAAFRLLAQVEELNFTAKSFWFFFGCHNLFVVTSLPGSTASIRGLLYFVDELQSLFHVPAASRECVSGTCLMKPNQVTG